MGEQDLVKNDLLRTCHRKNVKVRSVP